MRRREAFEALCGRGPRGAGARYGRGRGETTCLMNDMMI